MMNYSDVEAKVREATNDDAWGPHGTLMGEVAKYTFTYEHYPEAMAMLWKRMFESKKAWRRTYKVNSKRVRFVGGGTKGVRVHLKTSLCALSVISLCYCSIIFFGMARSAWFKAQGNTSTT